MFSFEGEHMNGEASPLEQGMSEGERANALRIWRAMTPVQREEAVRMIAREETRKAPEERRPRS